MIASLITKIVHSLRVVKKSLLVRFAVGITVPVLVVLSVTIVTHYWRESALFEDEVLTVSLGVGDMLLGNLKHAMLNNDQEMLAQIITDSSTIENIQNIQLINLDGQVKVASQPEEVGQRRVSDDVGCKECHQYDPQNRPRSSHLLLSPGVLRVSTPIANEAACQQCHSDTHQHLGVLLVDVSVAEIEQHIRNNLRIELLISSATVIAVIVGMYVLLNRLLVRQMVTLREPLARYAAGDFSTRLPIASGPPNELDRLAITLNQMADRLEQHTREQNERTTLRERAIVEERERIARELHDGFAQLLGYVNTKAMAVRLMLQKGQPRLAEKYLLQLEEAARKMFVDVREAILGLRMTGDCCQDFPGQINVFIQQYSRLHNLPVTVSLHPTLETLSLPNEIALQLMRIIQEALTNIRKHAYATEAWVTIEYTQHHLTLKIKDNGVGFSPSDTQQRRPHFGLGIMRERAATIGATFSVETAPGAGTEIQVQVPLSEE